MYYIGKYNMLDSIKRALISVSDKTGVVDFAKSLESLGVEIISTGGTYQHLIKHNIKVREVSTITNFPEMLDGRVKTLHPNIHGAILAKRENGSHQEQLALHHITPIDLVCVNLYPFEQTIANPECTLQDAIENIDIGGPAMIRSSAKNYAHVVVVTSPGDYFAITERLAKEKDLTHAYRLELAQKAFSHTAYYDSIISNYLTKELIKIESKPIFPNTINIPANLVQTLRYGENSHQQAAFYRDSGDINGLLASLVQLQGKELSYNNLVDADTAWECVKQFMLPACVIVKHANPCAVALGYDVIESYTKAETSDPVSSFGGIVALNQLVSADLAHLFTKKFLEVVIAPNYTEDALKILSAKPNLRVLQIKLTNAQNQFEYKRVGGGLLVQTPEYKMITAEMLKVVTQQEYDKTMLNDALFAWMVARFVKSNAIVLVKNGQTIGIGAGQMSRIDATKIATSKAHEFGFEVVGAICASDAFFPFRDNIDLLASMGIKIIIQPGGSIKDNEVIAAADEHGISMLFTGYRVFRH